MTGISIERFRAIEKLAVAIPASAEDRLETMIGWSESVSLPTSADQFAGEVIWVICCSGMKFAVARIIQSRVWEAINADEPVLSRFRHPGKAAAIETVWKDRERLYAGLIAANDRLAFCRSLPWIGEVTQYHLAKNIGVDCAKPDVHLKRLADAEGITAQALCERIASGTGYRVATVDLILWFACAHGIIDSAKATS